LPSPVYSLSQSAHILTLIPLVPFSSGEHSCRFKA
jgi:hypothetical protein